VTLNAVTIGRASGTLGAESTTKAAASGALAVDEGLLSRVSGDSVAAEGSDDVGSGGGDLSGGDRSVSGGSAREGDLDGGVRGERELRGDGRGHRGGRRSCRDELLAGDDDLVVEQLGDGLAETGGILLGEGGELGGGEERGAGEGHDLRDGELGCDEGDGDGHRDREEINVVGALDSDNDVLGERTDLAGNCGSRESVEDALDAETSIALQGEGDALSECDRDGGALGGDGGHGCVVDSLEVSRGEALVYRCQCGVLVVDNEVGLIAAKVHVHVDLVLGVCLEDRAGGGIADGDVRVVVVSDSGQGAHCELGCERRGLESLHVERGEVEVAQVHGVLVVLLHQAGVVGHERHGQSEAVGGCDRITRNGGIVSDRTHLDGVGAGGDDAPHVLDLHGGGVGVGESEGVEAVKASRERGHGALDGGEVDVLGVGVEMHEHLVELRVGIVAGLEHDADVARASEHARGDVVADVEVLGGGGVGAVALEGGGGRHDQVGEGDSASGVHLGGGAREAVGERVSGLGDLGHDGAHLIGRGRVHSEHDGGAAAGGRVGDGEGDGCVGGVEGGECA